MPRQSFNAPLGNPVNPRRMPSTSCMEFAQAVRPENQDVNDDYAMHHLEIMVLLSAGMVLFGQVVTALVRWPPERALTGFLCCVVIGETFYWVILDAFLGARQPGFLRLFRAAYSRDRGWRRRHLCLSTQRLARAACCRGPACNPLLSRNAALLAPANYRPLQ